VEIAKRDWAATNRAIAKAERQVDTFRQRRDISSRPDRERISSSRPMQANPRLLRVGCHQGAIKRRKEAVDAGNRGIIAVCKFPARSDGTFMADG